MANPRQKVSVPIFWNDTGTVIQDFQSTLAPFRNAVDLLGALNFSALWNQSTFIYDVAFGDNPHILKSFYQRGEEGRLFTTIEKFIDEEILRALFRDKAMVRGEVLYDKPTLPEIVHSWAVRDGDDRSKWVADIADGQRLACVNQLWKTLEHRPSNIQWYDPDSDKKIFRATALDLLNHQNLSYSIPDLNPRLLEELKAAAQSDPRFTLANLFGVLRKFSKDRSATILDQRLGYLNQQAIASSTNKGITGSDWGHGWAPEEPELRANKTKSKSTTVGEVIEDSSKIEIPAPALSTLAFLTVDDVLYLRGKAMADVFHINIDEETTEGNLRKLVDRKIADYWAAVCDYILVKKPDAVLKKRRLIVLAEERFKEFRSAIDNRTFERIVTAFVDILIGQAGLDPVRPELRRLRYRLIYEDSEEFESLKQPEWTVKVAWSQK